MALKIPEALLALESNCGVFALWILFQHHGIDKNINEFNDISGHDSEEGTFTIALAVALKKLGFDVTFYTKVDPNVDSREVIYYEKCNTLGISIESALSYQQLQDAMNNGKFVIVYYDTLDGVGNQSLVYSIDNDEICFFDSFDPMSKVIFEQQRKVDGICRQAIVIDDLGFDLYSTQLN